MLKRFWAWLKSIPVIGWIITGALFLLGLLGSRGRRDLGRPAPTLDPEAIAAERKRIAEELAEKKAEADKNTSDLEDEWDARYR